MPIYVIKWKKFKLNKNFGVKKIMSAKKW
jgi:hypothetical protein